MMMIMIFRLAVFCLRPCLSFSFSLPHPCFVSLPRSHLSFFPLFLCLSSSHVLSFSLPSFFSSSIFHSLCQYGFLSLSFFLLPFLSISLSLPSSSFPPSLTSSLPASSLFLLPLPPCLSPPPLSLSHPFLLYPAKEEREISFKTRLYFIKG